jgi:uncharacterized oxidoreductase
MKTIGNTILITGGSAGIGYEIAGVLSQKGNKVIITGRNKERLDQALRNLPNVTGYAYDVTKEEDVNELVEKLAADFPQLNVVINNAGQAYLANLGEFNDTFKKAGDEILTNYLSIVRLNEKLLSVLKTKEEAAIVNVSSIVAFVPNTKMATYGASKAALHSYTQSLRIVLAKTSNIKVFELMPPLVNTDFSQEIGGANGIPASVVAADLVAAMESDEYEIHVGRTANIFELFHASPSEALLAMNPN